MRYTNGVRAFADTNVLVYMFSDQPQKLDKAWSAALESRCVINVQVTMEFCNVCMKKLRFTSAEMNSALDTVLSICDERPVGGSTIRGAISIKERYGYSFYDSVMISSALENDCQYLLSEDMRDRQVIDGMTIVNIFAEKLGC